MAPLEVLLAAERACIVELDALPPPSPADISQVVGGLTNIGVGIEEALTEYRVMLAHVDNRVKASFLGACARLIARRGEALFKNRQILSAGYEEAFSYLLRTRWWAVRAHVEGLEEQHGISIPPVVVNHYLHGLAGRLMRKEVHEFLTPFGDSERRDWVRHYFENAERYGLA